MKRAIVFAHYDKDNIVDPYVYHYLRELTKISVTILFVSTVELDEATVEKLQDIGAKVIMRENSGHDFMSYKIGLDGLDYTDYDEVIICNDSVYGPFVSMTDVFLKMEQSVCDFWGITDNHAIDYHLQSYFMAFRKKVLSSDSFQNFWNNVKVLKDKQKIIEKYEVGLTQTLLSKNFKAELYTEYKPTFGKRVGTFLKKISFKRLMDKTSQLFTTEDSFKNIGKDNVTHYYWKELLFDSKMPFVKIELLRDNPMNSDISDWEEVVNSISDYDTTLIHNHLKRMKADSK